MRSAAMALAAVALASAPAALADWLGKAEAGFVIARGNTDTDSGNAKFDIAYELEKWKHSLAGSPGLQPEVTLSPWEWSAPAGARYCRRPTT